MKNRGIVIVWWKEMRDTIRDRRTLMSMIVMPLLLMPLLIVGIGKFTEQQFTKLEAQVPNVAIVAESGPASLVSFLESSKTIHVVTLKSSTESALRNNEVEAIIDIPNTTNEHLALQEAAEINITTISTRISSQTASQKITALLQAYNQQLQSQRFTARAIDPKILSGVVPKVTDIATSQERGGFSLGFLIPLFIVMWAMIGGQYTAIDATAGEKERKTLEALFLAPIRRLHLVLGKFLAVGTTSFVAIVASIISMVATVKFFGPGILAAAGGGAEQNIQFALKPDTIGLILFISILLVSLFSALLLMVAMFARSYREAQSYVSPLYLVVILPVSLFNSLPGLKVENNFFLIPGVNSILLFKELLLGTTNWIHIALTAGSLLMAAIIAIFLAVRMYQRESILLRS